MRVHILCRNWQEERIIPRMARALRDALSWTLSGEVDPYADVIYLLAYFEEQRARPWPRVPVAAYFTHREEDARSAAKAHLYDEVARRVQLRVAMCRLYGDQLAKLGPTVIPPLPVERERFVPARGGARNTRPVIGLSGYTYGNGRKGENVIRATLGSKVAGRVEWRASGRGWPVPTRGYTWAEMPSFYQGLDVLVCPSLVEGGPMPVLEALSCGVRVVVPRGVGLIDELPEMEGIHRYERGDAASLVTALEQAAFPERPADRDQLRAAVAKHSVEAFVEAHQRAFDETFSIKTHAVDRGSQAGKGQRGIYCVAFGELARKAAAHMMATVRQHMPDVPICLGAARRIGPEDVFVRLEDSDAGARRAKLMAYEVTPPEWQTVLYLDADTEVVAPVYRLFEWCEDGWELVICTDIQSMETLHVFGHKATREEVAETMRLVGTEHTLQYNGGVWAFRRCEATERFFRRWRAEWERWAQRDQGALLRALHTEPIKVWLLGNQWNTFPRFQPDLQTAGILHWPGKARRWTGAIPGRIDGPAAWRMVRQFEGKRRRKE